MVYFKLFLTSIFILFFIPQISSQSAADILIEKSIQYHDPENNWSRLIAHIKIQSIVDRKGVIDSSLRNIHMDLSRGMFEMNYFSDDDQIILIKSPDHCEGRIVGKPNASEEVLKEKNISCDRATMYDSYFRYLIGMPMKLKDPGTMINEKVSEKSYKAISYDVVTVTYEPIVGTYTWLFYFDKKSAELVLMEFSKDGTFENGETIELNKKTKYQDMILPGQLVWYVLPDRPFLAEENITYLSKK